MSRIANNPIKIPHGVEVNIADSCVNIKGTKGRFSHAIDPAVNINVEENILKVSVTNTSKVSKALSGTMRAVLQNSITGVSEEFAKKLEVVGVGYRATVKGKVLNLSLGFSHPVAFQIPEGITIEVPSQTEIIVKGFDRQQVGQVAANIRSYRPPEPYKGKGIRYSDEVIIRKEAKKS